MSTSPTPSGTVAPAVTVTGTAQHAAWQRRELPPVEQVRPGLWSVPVPIPHNPLRYTLCYLFAGSGGVVAVDPGWDSPEGRTALAAGLAAAGAGTGDVAGVVVTHTHPDHHGLSGWLREAAGAWIAMHPAEAASMPSRLWQGLTLDDDRAFLRAHGVPAGEVDTIAVDPEQVAALLAMAAPDRYLADGALVPIPDRQVRAVLTPGHTPGHLCLHDAEAGVLLTGDHLLPRISPTIGVHTDRDGDPLTDYLAALHRMDSYGEVEALPAHEYRFRGVPARARQLAAHHDHRAAEILAVLDAAAPPTTWQLAERITWSRGWDQLVGVPRRLALAETVAHLYQLRAAGTVTGSGDTPIRWRRA
ncbi:MBL fold hydrolase [Actinocatenispora thailandica]|uniref:MBL fold hydrolase n=1 Tax=Actinocatenispora thailandica TaxID=227318 RepID=A0A7R7HW23_9ACTN|nr:MBL fold metallo-hydrolase [Actinocatenispora thailandica]BCJ33698.1 MBL fold hydrolase [Actinocatenispora thailandica]